MKSSEILYNKVALVIKALPLLPAACWCYATVAYRHELGHVCLEVIQQVLNIAVPASVVARAVRECTAKTCLPITLLASALAVELQVF